MTNPYFYSPALLRHALLAGVCLLALHSHSAWAQDARSGTFKTVQGGVSVLQGEAKRVATSGSPLNEADRVQTDAQGAAVLMLRDGTTISIGPGTTVDLSRFQFNGVTQEGSLMVRLLQGSIRMVTGLLGKVQPENVKVITPTSTVSVRGTDFIVEVL
ncbi:FecR domain-containing protein [Rhodoferax sp.]|uniref:FecR family protein n=1 Tax=Rhodoferax sp. TaxID=50421 RepID=UPI0025E6B477|nr:FecR domain-containing protein [Rhodoferax sp.]